MRLTKLALNNGGVVTCAEGEEAWQLTSHEAHLIDAASLERNETNKQRAYHVSDRRLRLPMLF